MMYFAFSILGIVPDKPRNLTVTNITSRTAVISWLNPEEQEFFYHASRFFITLKTDNTIIWSNSAVKTNEFKLNNLSPYTTYEISVAAGNNLGFGEESVTSFLTSEEGEC